MTERPSPADFILGGVTGALISLGILSLATLGPAGWLALRVMAVSCALIVNGLLIREYRRGRPDPSD